MSDDSYRWIARWYDLLFDPMNRGLRSIGMKLLAPRPGMAVLDVGCGTGAHLQAYREDGCRLFGIDPSPAMLQVARTRLGDAAELTLGDASHMPYSDGTFDLVMACLVVHEMDPPVRADVITEIKRCLKIGGRLLVIDYHPGPVVPWKGWLTKVVILVAEFGAGRRHFGNYRNFMANNGVSHLADQHHLTLDASKVVSGGNIGVYLLRPQ